MIRALTLLLVFQLMGEALSRGLGLPIPGPVIGMLLLFGGLVWLGHVPDTLRATTHGLLSQLSLLFVPAGVGVMVYIAVLQRHWLPLLVTLVGSTAVTLLATALIMHLLTRGRSTQAR